MHFSDVARQLRSHSSSLTVISKRDVEGSVSSYAHSHVESQPCLLQKEYQQRELTSLESLLVIKLDLKTNRLNFSLNTVINYYFVDNDVYKDVIDI